MSTTTRLWRTSAVLMWLIAASFGIPTVPVAIYLLRHDELPWLYGMFPMYGGPVDAWVGTKGYALLIVLFGVLAIAEAAVGVLLWRRRPAGAVLSLALLPVEVAFWVAFALPFPPLWAAVRIALTLWAWRRQTAPTPSSTGASRTGASTGWRAPGRGLSVDLMR